MPLRAHLAELRKRVLLAAGGPLLGAVAGWFLYEPVFMALQLPLVHAGAERGGVAALNFTGVASSFDMKIKIALFLGVIVTSPWWLYQFWAFVTPGLNRYERRKVVGFAAASGPLFLAGALLAWWALPSAVRMLTEFTPDGAVNYIDAQTYLTFVMRLIVAFGVAFLVPVVMVGLNLAGLVRARTLARGWRWAVMLAFLFAALMSPTPDALTMIVLALPIVVLYFGAVLVCRVHDRRVDVRRTAQGLPGLDGEADDSVPDRVADTAAGGR